MQIKNSQPKTPAEEFCLTPVLDDDFMTGLREFEQLRKLALRFGDGQRRAHGKRLLLGAQIARLELAV